MSRKRFTNQEVINYIIDDIKDNPSTLLTDISNEQDFISLFGNKSNIELYGTITTEPQAQNIFFSNFYQRIVRKGIIDALNIKNPFITFKKEDLTYGDRWSRFITDIMDVKDFDPIASPMTVNKPRLAECFSEEPFRKLVEFTYSREQIQGMFLKDEGLDELLTELLKKQKQSLDNFVVNTLENVISNGDNYGNDDVYPNDDLFKIVAESSLITATMDENDRLFAKDVIDHKFKSLKAHLIQYAIKMSKPNRDFNNGDTDGPFMSSIPIGEGILLMNSNLSSVLEIYGDEFFKNNGDYKKYFKEVISIPFNNNSFLYAIVDPNWLEYRVLLEKTLDWTNPRALYTNYFSHLWFGYLVNPYVSSLIVRVSEV